MLALASGCSLVDTAGLAGRSEPPPDASTTAPDSSTFDDGAAEASPGDARLDVSPGPPTFDGPVVLARDSPGPRGLDVDGNRVYWANEDTGQIRSVLKTGSPDAGSTLFILAPGATDLVADTTRVNWIDRALTGGYEHALMDAKKDGTDRRYHFDNQVSTRMTIAGPYVYTSSGKNNGSHIFRFSSVDAVDLISLGGLNPKALASDALTVYYEHGGAVHTIPEPDGGGPFANAEAIDIKVDDDYVYWISSSGALQRLGKQTRGQPPQDLATGLVSPVRLALDSDSVYVTMWGTATGHGRVIRVPKAGGSSVDLAKDLSEPWGVAVDNTGVYVANHGDGAIVVIPRK